MAMVFVCTTDELGLDEIRRVDVEGRDPIAVCNVDGRFYAIDDTCTHGQASLSEGVVIEGEIECPFHGGTFCILTGKAVHAPCIVDTKTYPVIVTEGKVYLNLEKFSGMPP